MTPPSVAIVVCAYRSQEDHLRMALRSALAQTYNDLNVIVADDSPDDALRALVTGFNDARLRYRHNQPALGVARNHWQCLSEAESEFLVVLNHDDWLAPAFVSTLVAALRQHPEAVLAFCDHWVVNGQGRRLRRETDNASAAWGRSRLAAGLHRPFESLVVQQAVPMAMGTVFRRSALPASMPDDVGPAYDLWLSYLLCRPGAGAYYVPARLSAWRTHAGSLTHAAGIDWLRGAALCWHAIAADPAFAPLRDTARRKAAASWRACARRAWALGRRRDSLGFAWRALGLQNASSQVAGEVPTRSQA